MSIHQEVVLTATPERVYAALTNSAQFSEIDRRGAGQIATGEGGTFSLFGGAIHGRHVELVPNARLVQAWRVKMWEPGVYSLVRFTLTPDGNGTKLVLDHDGFPAEQEPHLAAGWASNYWEPLAKFFTS